MSAAPAEPLIYECPQAQGRARRAAWSLVTLALWAGFLALLLPRLGQLPEVAGAAIADLPLWGGQVFTALNHARESAQRFATEAAAMAIGWVSLRREDRSGEGESEPSGALSARPALPPGADARSRFSDGQLQAIRKARRVIAHHDDDGQVYAVTMISGRPEAGRPEAGLPVADRRIMAVPAPAVSRRAVHPHSSAATAFRAEGRSASGANPDSVPRAEPGGTAGGPGGLRLLRSAGPFVSETGWNWRDALDRSRDVEPLEPTVRARRRLVAPPVQTFMKPRSRTGKLRRFGSTSSSLESSTPNQRASVAAY